MNAFQSPRRGKLLPDLEGGGPCVMPARFQSPRRGKLLPDLPVAWECCWEASTRFNPLDGENCFLTPTLNTCVIPAPSNTLFDRVWPRGGTFSNSSGPLPISLSFTLGCAPDSLRGFSNTRCRRKTSKFPFNNTELRACSSSQNASSPLRPLPNAVVGEHRISLSITLDFNS